MSLLRRFLNWAGNILNRQDRNEELPDSIISSCSNSGISTDETVPGSLSMKINHSVDRPAFWAAQMQAFADFDATHGHLKVHPEKKLLMERLDTVTSALSAHNVLHKHLRAEIATQDCIFHDTPWDKVLTMLGKMKKTVSDAKIAANKTRIRELFDFHVVRRDVINPSGMAALSFPTNEQELVSDYDSFVKDASGVLGDMDNRRQVRFKTNAWSASLGLVAKRQPRTNRVDEAAGYRQRTDFQLAFGHTEYQGKTLVAGEAKFHRTRKEMTKPWWTFEKNHLPELMASIVGKLAFLGVAVCNYGMKVILVDTPTDPGPSTFRSSPPGELYLDLSVPVQVEMAFEFWLAVVALAVPEDPVTAQLPVFEPVKVVEGSTTQTKNGLSRKRGRNQEEPGNGSERHPSPTKKRSIIARTRDGTLVEFTSIDLEKLLTEEELDELSEQFEMEREMDFHMDSAQSNKEELGYSSTQEPETPWLIRAEP